MDAVKELFTRELLKERVFEGSIRCSYCNSQQENPNGQPYLWQYYRMEAGKRSVIKGWYCDDDCLRLAR